MALRFGGKGKKVAEAPVEEMAPEMPVEEPMPEEAAPEPMPEEPAMEMAPPMGVVDPMIAGYKGPEMGPFMCANCQFYAPNDEPGTCQIVAGPIEEQGVCNMFSPMQGPAEEEPMEEEPMLEEAPAEEAPMEAPAEEPVVE